MATQLNKVLILITFLNINCNEVSKPEKNNDQKNLKINYYDSLKCDQLDINEIKSNESNFICLQQQLFDIVCLDNLKDNSKNIIRIIKITSEGKLSLVSIENIDSGHCFFKTKQSILHYGIVSYKLQDIPIEYHIIKNICHEEEFNNLFQYKKYFKNEKVTLEYKNVNEIFIFESFEKGIYSKLTLNNKIIDKKTLIEINKILE